MKTRKGRVFATLIGVALGATVCTTLGSPPAVHANQPVCCLADSNCPSQGIDYICNLSLPCVSSSEIGTCVYVGP
jgi:hypothetical protein